MNVLVVGKGGREHALVWKLAQSPRIDKLYVAPGNPGMADLAECVDIRVDTPVSERDKLFGEIERLIAFAKERQIGLTVIGPDDALAGGIVDRFQEHGLKVFGPTEAAAQIESSKAFAKELMERIGVPTARHRTFTTSAAACDYIRAQGAPIVVKASGLAAGKGAVVCHSEAEALATAREMLEEDAFGSAGSEIVIEDYMLGEEASLFALCDGEHFVTLVPAQDHKAIYEGDKGPNPGGMGAYAPAPVMTPELVQEAETRIIQPVLDEMRRMGIPYQGVLYCGLMFTEEGPKVVEFNARFGDPECQILMPLIQTDLVDILEAACDGRLDQVQIANSSEAAVCVVMASNGYPGSYDKGFAIGGLETFADRGDIVVYHAGTARCEGGFCTDSGRVLCVTAIGADIQTAVDKVYTAVDQISFDNAYCRRDIAHRALARDS
ncbi:MAG: phosphoribosylamine--glycine ligase [Candidatus Latescibacterota bacterium]|nr:phosphoribosylamine--glycine ligase [Candidatus Latescibacterota bacterium]